MCFHDDFFLKMPWNKLIIALVRKKSERVLGYFVVVLFPDWWCWRWSVYSSGSELMFLICKQLKYCECEPSRWAESGKGFMQLHTRVFWLQYRLVKHSFVEGVEMYNSLSNNLSKCFNNVCQPHVFMMQRIFQAIPSVKMLLKVKTWFVSLEVFVFIWC